MAAFSWYDHVTNAVAPILTQMMIKISPCLRPFYRFIDECTGKNEGHLLKPGRPSNSYKPVVVFCSVAVKDVAKYKEAFRTYAETTQSAGLGVRACFSYMDEHAESTALQFWWYDSADDFSMQPKALTSCYVNDPERNMCHIWGGWDGNFKLAISSIPGINYSFVKEMRGFIREPSAAGFDTQSTPMIWISKRQVKAGRMAACGDNFQKGADMMYEAAPAALAICEYTSEDDPDATWSLRIFNDFHKGFKAHFPVPSFILFRMVFNVIPEWAEGPFPIGISFSSEQMIADACRCNAGNKAYKQYYWDKGRIGPAPDFAKGFSKAAPITTAVPAFMPPPPSGQQTAMW